MRRIGFGLIVALGVVSAGCNKSDPVDPNVPARLVKVDGEPQNGLAGTPADAPLRVRVDNSAGDPVAGVTVTWAVMTGGGAVSVETQQTSSQGISSVNFVYGDAGPQTINATVPGLTGSPQTFTLTAAGGVGGGGGDGGL